LRWRAGLPCSPQGSFPQSLKPAELKAAYRFFDNTQDRYRRHFGAAHCAKPLDRMRQVLRCWRSRTRPNLICRICTTTEGLGYGTGGNERGFMMAQSAGRHAREGLPLGVLGMKTWGRAQEEAGKGRDRKARPIAEKESIKWIEGIKHLARLRTRCAEPGLSVWATARATCMNCFATERPDGVDWLIRAAQQSPRPSSHAISVGVRSGHGTAWPYRPAGARRGSMPRRTARLTLRCAAVATAASEGAC